jgi:uncharacterized membrane protein
MPHERLRPLTTTLIGGVVFLLPLVVVLAVVGHALQIAIQAVSPLVQALPQGHVAGIAVATVAAVLLLVALCYGAGVLARAALGRRLSTSFEDKLTTVYPRYHVIKAMSQGLHGAIGQQLLRPVLVGFDEQQQIGYDIERLADGRAVVFVPGAPDAWSGSVLLVDAGRLQPLAIDPTALARALQGMGRGLGALLSADRRPAS